MGIERKTAAATASDLGEGIVEAIVNVTNIVDHGNDLVVPGAYADTLRRRIPKAVWSHDWTKPVGKVLAVEEWMPGDPRLPQRLKTLNAGALWAKIQFNLDSDQGREAYAYCKFFADEAEFSIGYDCNGPHGKAERDGSGVRRLVKVNLHEVSPVLFGMAPYTQALSVKSGEAAYAAEEDEEDGTDQKPVRFGKQLSGASITRLAAAAKGHGPSASAARGVLTRYGIDWKNFGARGSLSAARQAALMRDAAKPGEAGRAARATLTRFGVPFVSPHVAPSNASRRSGRPATDKQRRFAAVLLRNSGRKPSLADAVENDSGVISALIDALNSGDGDTVDRIIGASTPAKPTRRQRETRDRVADVPVSPQAIRDAARAYNADEPDIDAEVAAGEPLVVVRRHVDNYGRTRSIHVSIGVEAEDGGFIPAGEPEVMAASASDDSRAMLRFARLYGGQGVTVAVDQTAQGIQFRQYERPDGSSSQVGLGGASGRAMTGPLSPRDQAEVNRYLDTIHSHSTDPILRGGPVVTPGATTDSGTLTATQIPGRIETLVRAEDADGLVALIEQNPAAASTALAAMRRTGQGATIERAQEVLGGILGNFAEEDLAFRESDRTPPTEFTERAARFVAAAQVIDTAGARPPDPHGGITPDEQAEVLRWADSMAEQFPGVRFATAPAPNGRGVRIEATGPRGFGIVHAGATYDVTTNSYFRDFGVSFWPEGNRVGQGVDHRRVAVPVQAVIELGTLLAGRRVLPEQGKSAGDATATLRPVLPGDRVRVDLGRGLGEATGRVEKIAHGGRLKVPGGAFAVEAKADDPALLIRLERDGHVIDKWHGAPRSAVTTL